VTPINPLFIFAVGIFLGMIIGAVLGADIAIRAYRKRMRQLGIMPWARWP
jgi:hypothetical protein